MTSTKQKYTHIKLSIIIVTCVVISLYSLTVGYYSISIKDTIRALFYMQTHDLQAANIIHNIRLPRVIAALLIGSSLASSGAAYQGMFKNPLVSPDILGVSSGASVGAAIAILLGKGLFVTQVYAFIFGLIAVCISYVISLRSKLSQTISLILTGTMIGSVCTSIVSMIKYAADPTDSLPSITFWLMGSLSKIQSQGIIISLVPTIIGMSILLLARWKLNILMLEDDEAKSLGVNPKTWKLVIIFASTLLTSSAICLGGLIGWVGLMIPHIARFLFGSNYRYLIPSSIVLGALFLLVIDTFIRTCFQSEVPTGVFTSILGAPFFIFLIIRKPTKAKGPCV